MQESVKARATIALGTLWVLVFAAMAATQGGFPNGVYPFGRMFPATTSHRFGDLTPRELLDGQVWRAVTATFIHYNLLHLALNLIGLIQLGRIVESWYGPGPLLGIYLIIGGLGNLAAGLARAGVEGQADVHCGGGSTVVLGLIALVAVVGWRSHADFRARVWLQMLALLVLSGLLGLLPNIDNYGHAAGALCGAAVGLADAALLRRAERPGRSWAVPLAALALAACALAQFRDDRDEARAAAARMQVVWDLVRIHDLYALQAQDLRPVLLPRGPRPLRRPPLLLKARGDRTRTPLFWEGHLLGLSPLVLPADPRPALLYRAAMAQGPLRQGSATDDLDAAATAGPYRQWKVLAARALLKPPTPEEFREFDALSRRLLARAAPALARTSIPTAGRPPRAR